MAFVWLSIGSNIEREQNIRLAVNALRSHFGNLMLSPVYETAAIGFQGTPFFNLVAGCHTTLSPMEMARTLKQIEINLGRQPSQAKYSSRSIDIDLLTYDDLCLKQAGLQLPRAEILQYAFVLGPLADVAPNQLHPKTQKSYAQHWQQFSGERALIQVEINLE